MLLSDDDDDFEQGGEPLPSGAEFSPVDATTEAIGLLCDALTQADIPAQAIMQLTRHIPAIFESPYPVDIRYIDGRYLDVRYGNHPVNASKFLNEDELQFFKFLKFHMTISDEDFRRLRRVFEHHGEVMIGVYDDDTAMTVAVHRNPRKPVSRV